MVKNIKISVVLSGGNAMRHSSEIPPGWGRWHRQGGEGKGVTIRVEWFFKLLLDARHVVHQIILRPQFQKLDLKVAFLRSTRPWKIQFVCYSHPDFEREWDMLDNWVVIFQFLFFWCRSCTSTRKLVVFAYGSVFFISSFFLHSFLYVHFL